MSATGTLRRISRSSPSERRPAALWPLLAVMAYLSVGGFAGGIPLLRDPTGTLAGAKLSWLEKTPVDDFVLPGIFLVAVYGVGVLVLTAGLIWRSSPGPLHRLDVATGRHWAWWGTIAVGSVLVIWILYEFLVLPAISWLMPTLLAVGFLLIGMPLLPTMRNYYKTEGSLDRPISPREDR